MFTVDKIEWNSDLVGFELISAHDDRIAYVQFELNENVLHGDYNTFYAVFYNPENEFSDSEIKNIMEFVNENETIVAKSIEFDELFEESGFNVEKFTDLQLMII